MSGKFFGRIVAMIAVLFVCSLIAGLGFSLAVVGFVTPKPMVFNLGVFLILFAIRWVTRF